MSATAAAHADVISLDDYRRARASRTTSSSIAESATQAPLARPVATVPGPMWVYWVPVWIW